MHIYISTPVGDWIWVKMPRAVNLISELGEILSEAFE